MTLEVPTDFPQDNPSAPQRRPPSYNSYIGILMAVIAAIVVLLGLLVLVLANRDSGDNGQSATAASVASTAPPPGGSDQVTTSGGSVSSTGQTTTVPATTSTQASTTASSAASTSRPTSSSTTPSTGGGQAVVWPVPGGGTTYDTPEAAARGFAVDFVGFREPVFGTFSQGDGRSGEIELRPAVDGPKMTVLLRQVGTDGSWSVTAVTSENIIIDKPEAGALIANPVVLEGKARAFEGQVDVRLFEDGRSDPVAEGFVTGRGDGVLGAFSDKLAFPASTFGSGVLVFTEFSANDGAPWNVAAVPVIFSR